jgi:choline-sulfatase
VKKGGRVKPANLLIILSDQHNKRALGCYGHPHVRTPNIDRLAARGTRFTSAWTNSPICVPARAAFATGRYVHRIRCWDNAIAYDGQLPSWGHRTMAQGHRTVSIGKLHYTRCDPARNGFHEELMPMHIADGLGDLAGLIRDELIVRTGDRSLARESGPGESHYCRYDREIADAACRWIATQGASRHERPWVLYVGFVCPHPPFVPPPAFHALYAEQEIALPERYAEHERPRHPWLDAMRRMRPYDEGFRSPDEVRHAIACYYGLVSYLDHNVGRVLDALDASGLAGSTRVIYGSDHGENLGARGFWGKSTLYEESAGIPLIVAGPDVPEGCSVDTPVTLVDAFPTILECVGARPDAADADLAGDSLVAIAGGRVPTRSVLTEYHASASISAAFAIRRGRYKYIHYTGFAPMLFDVARDPCERHDLAAEPEHAAARAECEAALRALLDPEAVDRLAKADQAATIARAGGRERIMSRGSIHHTPPPGVATTLTPVEGGEPSMPLA